VSTFLIRAAVVGTLLACGSGAAYAAPDWSKVPSKQITIFYPGGALPVEWVMNNGVHTGAGGIRTKNLSCVGCHEPELAAFGAQRAAAEKVKVGSIAVAVQAAYDAGNLYLRFAWKQPADSGLKKMDQDNQVKLSVMFENNKIELAKQVGCWQSCHQDARTMPKGDENKTKYVVGGSLASGKYYDLIQWASGKGGEFKDGYVAEKRVMEGGKALTDAKGDKAGDTWTVTFTRKLTGGEGDIAMADGGVYNLGFAIHEDYTSGRFHYVSLGYTLGLGAKADLTAVKQ